MMGHWRTAVLLALVGAALCACDGSANSPADAERARGKALLTSYGCVSCHSIKGLQAGAGAAGPPLEDQQLGGLIMWVPGGLAYVIAGLVLCAGWLRLTPQKALP